MAPVMTLQIWRLPRVFKMAPMMAVQIWRLPTTCFQNGACDDFANLKSTTTCFQNGDRDDCANLKRTTTCFQNGARDGSTSAFPARYCQSLLHRRAFSQESRSKRSHFKFGTVRWYRYPTCRYRYCIYLTYLFFSLERYFWIFSFLFFCCTGAVLEWQPTLVVPKW